jgi:hypothetical protein
MGARVEEEPGKGGTDTCDFEIEIDIAPGNCTCTHLHTHIQRYLFPFLLAAWFGDG